MGRGSEACASGVTDVHREQGFRVKQQINHAHPTNMEYPLLPNDFLIELDNGSFYKFGPGVGMVGFRLSEKQRERIEPITAVFPAPGGLAFWYEPAEADHA